MAYPATGTALNPDLIGISLETTIELKSGATTTDQQTAIAAATTSVQNYINNLGISKPLVLNEISDQILNSSPLIVDVGQPNQPLDAVYIWRSRSDGTRYSRSLIADYTPTWGERICSISIDIDLGEDGFAPRAEPTPLARPASAAGRSTD